MLRLVNVNSIPIFKYICLRCGGVFYTSERPAYADLNAAPFSAYYCEPCVQVIPPNQIEGGDPKLIK